MNISFYGLTPKLNVINKTEKPLRQVNQTFTPELSIKTDNIKGKLDEYTLNLLNEIRELFELAHSSIKAVAKSGNTRNAIKNGYPAIKKGVAGSRILEFENIGNNGENISVNLRIDHGKEKKTIIGIDKQQLVINARGQIEKNPSMRFVSENNVRKKNEKLQFFTQKEIDSMNTINQFSALKNELQKYLGYIANRHKAINDIREKRADNIPGNLDNYKELIGDITDNFNYFKTHINKLTENKLDKALFRMYNKVKTMHGQNSMLLKDATTDGRSLFVGFTKFNQKKVMKICVMDYNNKTIDKSFIIYDNKLAKYSPKKVTDRPKHTEYGFHYYTQEEIDKSELEKYMYNVLDRLEDINDNLKQGIEERRSK